MNLFKKEEKKVEYLELIYDLIFVYMVGRNNALIHNIQNGFVEPKFFMGYVLCTLAIIQIWNFSTLYINMFGRNSIRDHVFLFINMYLLYFVGQSTGSDWQAFQTQYYIAWGLILLNIGIQFLIELRNHRMTEWNKKFIKRMSTVLFVEAGLVFIAAFLSPIPGAWVTAAAILSGILLTTVFSKQKSIGGWIDFAHLTERAMLYVVLTFGEMIIAVASYFNGDGGLSWNTIYFSLMAFLIVVGLFLSYGIFYDHLIDRDGQYDGMLYMGIHVFIIFSMNNITASLEFMREPEIAVMPKMLFLLASFAGYFIFLFCLQGHIRNRDKLTRPICARAGVLTVIFVVLMILLRENMYINIFLSVVYVFAVFLIIYRTRAEIIG